MWWLHFYLSSDFSFFLLNSLSVDTEDISKDHNQREVYKEVSKSPLLVFALCYFSEVLKQCCFFLEVLLKF